MPLHKKMFLSNYYDIISDAFYSITGKDRKIECILEDEIVKDKEENRVDVDKNEDINN